MIADKIEAFVDRLIGWRAQRLLAKAVKIHGPKAEYRLTDTIQVQTPTEGPVLLAKGENIRWPDAPNHAMVPSNDAGRAVQKAYHRTQTATVLIQPLGPRTLTFRERQERASQAQRLCHDNIPPVTGV